MYLYVTGEEDDGCKAGAAAWALPCLFHYDTNRPVLASANICPSALSLADDSARTQLVAIVTHELLHALVSGMAALLWCIHGAAMETSRAM